MRERKVTRTNHPILNSREEWKQSENVCSIKISMSARNATPFISPDQQQTHQNDNSASEQTTRRSRENGGVGFKKPSYLNRDGPPLDDGCPICSGTLDVPCKNTTIFIGFLFQFKDPASLIESNPAVKKIPGPFFL